jgi:hypothetical protein
VIIANDTIYCHKILRVNYTTYDMRREQDSINARTHPDIMLLSRDDKADKHPYWYARVRGIFHARAFLNDPTSMAPARMQDIEFVWVRYLGIQYQFKRGFKYKRLPIVGFVDPTTDETSPFDFIDPKDIIRSSHLIPDWTSGQGENGIGPTIAREPEDGDMDWNYFYVNM